MVQQNAAVPADRRSSNFKIHSRRTPGTIQPTNLFDDALRHSGSAWTAIPGFATDIRDGDLLSNWMDLETAQQFATLVMTGNNTVQFNGTQANLA